MLRIPLDHHRTRAAMLPRPGVHLGRRVPRIDGEHRNRQAGACYRKVVSIQHRRELLPNSRLGRLPCQHLVIYRPGLLAATPGHHLHLDAVLLDIDSRREEQPAIRHVADAIVLAPIIEPLPVRGLSPQRPRLP